MQGRAASTAKAQKMVSEAGMSKDPASEGTVKHPGLRTAVQKVLNAKPGTLAAVAGMATATPFIIKAVKTLMTQGKTSQAVGDVVADIADKFGPDIAASYATGDVMGMWEGLAGLSQGQETTGDPELDEAIIGDVLDELDGDPEVGDAEIGGLFKRIRINAAIRAGNRRANRVARKRGRIRRKRAENQALVRAKRFSKSQHLGPQDYAEGYQEQQPEENTEFSDQGYSNEGGEYDSYSESDFAE